MRVCIEDIAERLEMASDDWDQFFNVETGEIVILSNNMYDEADEELAERIENSDLYVILPGQYEIHEWRIMESFTMEIISDNRREELLRVLHKPKSYRRFKDAINRLGLDSAYYEYRFRVFCKIAVEWCEHSNIQYYTKTT